jgi:hypothetical protein
MVRESVLAVALAPVAGCSFALDFSPSAVPVDAEIDAPYIQAECDHLEPNDAFSGAVAIAPTERGPAAICQNTPEDHDFYRFSVPPSTADVTIKILFTNREGGDLDLRIRDLEGNELGAGHAFTDDETVTCPGVAPACPSLAVGDYIFEVYPALSGAVNRYEIALTLSPSS